MSRLYVRPPQYDWGYDWFDDCPPPRVTFTHRPARLAVQLPPCKPHAGINTDWRSGKCAVLHKDYSSYALLPAPSVQSQASLPAPPPAQPEALQPAPPRATRGIAASRSSATDASETCGGAGHCRASHTRSRTSGTRGGYFRLRCRRGPRLGIGLRCSPPTLPSPAPLAAPTAGVRRDDDRSEAIEHAPDLRRAPGAAARSRDALLFKPAAMPVRLVTPAACSSAMIGSPVSHWRPPCAMPTTFSSSTRRQGR
jgi:hypothetical protein